MAGMESRTESDTARRNLKLDRAREMVAALERALQTRRLYQPHHLLYLESTEMLVKRTLDFFTQFEYLRAEIRPDGLLFEEHYLLKGEERDMEIPMRLYKDGIRIIRFRKGITREEVLDFLALFETNSRELYASGQDLVILIWNRAFPSIDYAVVDEFDSENTGITLTSRQVSDVREVVRSLTRITEGLKTLRLIPAAGDVTRPQTKSMLRPATLTDDEMDAIFREDLSGATQRVWGEIEYETFGGIIRRSFEILFRIFEEERGKQDKDLAPLVGGVAWIYLRKQDLGALGHFLENSQKSKLLSLEHGGVSLDVEVRKEIESTVTPAVFRRFITTGFTGDYEGLGKFLDFLGPTWVDRVGAVYGEATDDAIRAHMRRFLLKWKDKITVELCRQIFRNTTHCRKEVFDIFSEAACPGLLDLMSSYFSSLDADTRMMALKVIIGMSDPGKLDFVCGILTDNDKQLRASTLRLVADSRRAEFRDPLLELIRANEFRKREAWEKTLALRALAQCAGIAAVAVLRQIVETKPPMFGRAEYEDTRRAAVLALGELATPLAISWLKGLSTSNDEQLRLYADEAVRNRDRGTER